MRPTSLLRAKFSPSDLLWVLGLMALASLIFWQRWHLRDQNYQPDVVYYSVLGDGFLRGLALYSDMWERKPPATALTYALAESFTGFNRGSVLFLNWVTALGTLGVLLWTSWRITRDRWQALFAAGLFSIIGGDFGLQASEPNVECFMNLFTLVAFGLWIGPDPKPPRPFSSVLLGSLWAWACAYKPIAIVGFLFCSVADGVSSPAGSGRRGRVLSLLWAWTAFALIWATIFGYFSMTGQGEVFFRTFFEVNSSYAGNILGNFYDGLCWGKLVPRFASFLIPLFVLTLFGISRGLFSGQRRVPLMLLAFTLAAWTEVSLPGKFFPHYYQLWIPALCLGTAYALFPPDRTGFHIQWRVGAAFCLSIFLIAHEFKWYGRPIEKVERSRGQSVEDRKGLVAAVDQLLLPGETFFTWSYSPLFYLDCQRRAPVPFGPACVFLPVLGETFTQKMIVDLEEWKPELVILDPSFTPDGYGMNRGFLYLMDHYAFFGKILDYRLFYRKEGRLEPRLKAGPLRVPPSRKISKGPSR